MRDDPTGDTLEHNTKTDWERLRAMTDADIHTGIESDSDAMPTDEAFCIVDPRYRTVV